MRFVVLAMVCLSLCAGELYGQDAAAPGPAAAPGVAIDPKDAAEIASYGIGMNTGRSIKSEGIDIDLEAFLQGIRDGAGAAKPKYTDEQVRAAIVVFQRMMQAKKEQRQQAAAGKNQAEGRAFLAKNKTVEGVKTLPSGLQYQVLRAGNGASPKATDTVKVHYEGTLLDGTVFDSSIKRKKPATFQVGRVIPGWTEAIQLMHVGDRWRLFIPSELAYGAGGTGGGLIGPHAVLIFDVELLGIEPAARDAVPRIPRP